jgi:hypothetical protein
MSFTIGSAKFGTGGGSGNFYQAPDESAGKTIHSPNLDETAINTNPWQAISQSDIPLVELPE